MSEERFPFPTKDGMKADEGNNLKGNSSTELELNISVPSSVHTQSHATTTSSELTSSDKLSALPISTSPAPTPKGSRVAQTFNYMIGNSSTGNAKGGHRHSFDSYIGTSRIENNSPFTPGIRDGNTNRINEGFRSQETPSTSGKVTPQQRVSFDSDLRTIPTLPSVSHPFSRRGNEQTPASPPQLSSSDHEFGSQSDINHLTSPSRSLSKSRGHSPLRLLHNLSSGFHRGRVTSEERFVPIDPFKFRAKVPLCRLGSQGHNAEPSANSTYDCDDLISTYSIKSIYADVRDFTTDTLPREIYLNFLLRLPAMYFSRVARIFEDADVSRPDIHRMISNSGARNRQLKDGLPLHSSSGPPPGNIAPGTLSAGIGLSAQASIAPAATMMHMPLPFPDEWTPPIVSPALIRFKHSWEAFIDSLLKEWKTLNLVSALLASAILTIFQTPNAASDPITRTFSLMSLICALMSLSYGCIYIVRFGTMRNMFHASRWAEEARKTNTSIFWNVWVLLATPAVWMAWSMVLFLSAIMTFVWRTGAVDDPDMRAPLSPKAALACRITITSIFFLGIVYFGLIVKTLRLYSSHSAEWHRSAPSGNSPRIQGARREKQSDAPFTMDYKLGDIEAGLQRRGRERERGDSVHVRRREDDPERPRKKHNKDGKNS